MLDPESWGPIIVFLVGCLLHLVYTILHEFLYTDCHLCFEELLGLA